MNQTVVYVNIMKESLERKKKYLQEICELTKKQEVLAKAETFDEDAFGQIIEKKDILINNVNEIDKGFSSVYDRVRIEVIDNKDKYSSELRCIQGLIRECVDIGVQIEALEERNKLALEQAFSSGFKGIKQVKKSKNVANKYYKSMANGMVNDSTLYDRKK